MRGFWKTGKELSDRAEISRISSWALGALTCKFQPDWTTLKGGGGGGWGWVVETFGQILSMKEKSEGDEIWQVS